MMAKVAFILAFLAVIFLAARSRAGLVASNMVTYASVSANTTSAPVVIGTVYLPQNTFTVQNGGLTNVGELSVVFQMSLGTNNFITIFTYNPSVTNAVIDSTNPPNNGLVTIYAQAVIVPTNTISVGVQSLQQH